MAGEELQGRVRGDDKFIVLWIIYFLVTASLEIHYVINKAFKGILDIFQIHFLLTSSEALVFMLFGFGGELAIYIDLLQN